MAVSSAWRPWKGQNNAQADDRRSPPRVGSRNGSEPVGGAAGGRRGELPRPPKRPLWQRCCPPLRSRWRLTAGVLADEETNRLACRASAHGLGPWSRFVGCDLRDGVVHHRVRRRRRERQQDAREGRRDATLRHNEANACYPGSIVILGDSRGTGDDSDPNRPNTDVPANDWATGTNPAVDSVYLRLLARDPAIKGHNYNLAQDGTNVDVLADKQAPSAVKLLPAPQLFLVSTGGNDMTTCPAHPADVKAYGAALAKALSVLASGAPQSHTFIVSQWGSPATYAKA